MRCMVKVISNYAEYYQYKSAILDFFAQGSWEWSWYFPNDFDEPRYQDFTKIFRLFLRYV